MGNVPNAQKATSSMMKTNAKLLHLCASNLTQTMVIVLVVILDLNCLMVVVLWHNKPNQGILTVLNGWMRIYV